MYRDRTGVDVTTLESAARPVGLAGGLAAIGARARAGFDVVADLVGLEDALAARRRSSSPARASSTPRASPARWSAACSSSRRTPTSPRRGVIAGQVTDEAREEASVLGDVTVLALTDRVWQAGEAFARAALLVEEAAVELHAS